VLCHVKLSQPSVDSWGQGHVPTLKKNIWKVLHSGRFQASPSQTDAYKAQTLLLFWPTHNLQKMCYTIGPSSAIISYSKRKKPHVSILGPQWSEIVTEKPNILYSNFKIFFEHFLSLSLSRSLQMTLAGFEPST